MEKKEVRRIIRERKKLITPEDRIEFSRKVSERAFQELSELPASKIALFLSMPDEVDTSHLIELLEQQGKHTLLVPRVEDDVTINFYRLGDTSKYDISGYGIKEPTEDTSKALVPDVMIVPGIAFDLFGGRVGRGRGYYDRYFERYSEVIRLKIAVAYQLQVMEERVPMDPYDQTMDVLITEESRYTF